MERKLGKLCPKKIKFFHTLEKIRAKQMIMTELVTEEALETNHDDILNEQVSYCKKVYTKPNSFPDDKLFNF